MSFGPSLYRRHRPRTFADVVGQEHVVRTLRNAVFRGEVHHAYLFVGSRGTGKTSMAKILAACLNCERRAASGSAATVEPCGACDSCTAIAHATSLDVIEMDAASHNSVDDIRELRDRVGYAPVSGRHKVYILDEAHMLSPQAWNAFLKTLEEPPPNTVFVLATTEAQKVLPTVVDRCHRFDFTRPSVEQIAAVLRRTAEAEGIATDVAALALVARSATGSFRDALGTLEQLVAYGTREGATGAIGVEDVVAVLGVADDDLLFEALDAVGSHDPRQALRAAARLGDAGRDAGQLFRDLEAHARELLVVGLLGEVPPELRLTPDRDTRLGEQARRLRHADVVRTVDLLAAGIEAARAGADARIQLELALVKAAAPEVDPSTRALLARIDRLEARLGGASPATPPAPAPAQVVRMGAADGGAAAAAPAEPVASEASADDPPDLAELEELWPAVVEALRAQSAMLAALLASARPVALAGSRLTVAFPATAAFGKRKAEGEANRARAVDALRAVVGRHDLTLAYELRDDLEAPAAGPAAPALSDEELVAHLVSALDAEEIPVSDDQEEG